ncbi:proteoglycan 4-like, partial [Sceloporus undulatus]|uniref:proteoglycan 4-like n=1 Tax=Sceloporus undulatus TaxID=8520 RepID=UPI001C4D0C1C
MPAPFKKCDVCRGKVPVQDPHSSCLFCLGRDHDARACHLCKSLSSQARKNRESRLTSAIALGKVWEGRPRSSSLPPAAPPASSSRASASNLAVTPTSSKKRRHTETSEAPPPKKSRSKTKKHTGSERPAKSADHASRKQRSPSKETSERTSSCPEATTTVHATTVPTTPLPPTQDLAAVSDISPQREPSPLSVHSDEEEAAPFSDIDEPWGLDTDMFFDTETQRYYMSVPKEKAFREFTRLNLRPAIPQGDKPSSSQAVASSLVPRRPPSEPPAPQIPARTPSRVRVTDIPLTSDSDSDQDPLPPSRESSDGEDDPSDPPSPQEMHHPGSSSPTDDVRSFSEHIIKMCRTLDIELSPPEEEARDPVERRVLGRVPTPPCILMLPSLQSIVQRSWDAPTSLAASSRKVETLYRIASPTCPWLTDHPKPNSAIVEGAQQTFVPKQATSPADREAKKIDGLVKKAYSSAALIVKAINYNACMGAYIQALMEEISPIVPDVPDDVQCRLVEIRDEAHSIGNWIITASRNVADCAERGMAASLALRRHAWLRGSDLNANVKSAIEDMPLDGTGLFHADTDERLNRKFRMKAAAKKHGMSSAPISPFRRRHRPWPPQGPVVCN